MSDPYMGIYVSASKPLAEQAWTACDVEKCLRVAAAGPHHTSASDAPPSHDAQSAAAAKAEEQVPGAALSPAAVPVHASERTAGQASEPLAGDAGPASEQAVEASDPGPEKESPRPAKKQRNTGLGAGKTGAVDAENGEGKRRSGRVGTKATPA